MRVSRRPSLTHRPLPWRRALRRAARWGLSLRWRIRPPNFGRTYKVRVNGFDLVVLPTVFHPTWHFTSRFFAEECDRLLAPELATPLNSVLEVGTGTGLVALSAAGRATRVVATDINPLAVECARRNAEANGLADKVHVLEGDMFAPVAGRRFDVILCNPPYFKGSPRSTVELAYMGGENLEWIRSLAAQARDHLAEGGALYCVFGDAGDVMSLVDIFRREGWSSECVARRSLMTEQLSIWKFT